MSKLRAACITLCVVLCLAVFGGLISPSMVAAQEEETSSQSEARLVVNAKYPVRSGPSSTVFDFSVELQYKGADEPATFELAVEGPADWLVRIQQSSMESKEISAIRLDPSKSYPDSIAVMAVAPYWLYPEPGEYHITLRASSGSIEESFELTARITASYAFTVETADERFNIKATAGKESQLKIIVKNTGTAALDKITFSAMEPRGIAGEEWSVTYEPEQIENLSPGHEQEVDVTIKPPPKTIAGDYMLTLQYLSDPTTANPLPVLDIRVTVGTSTAWGWIGALIVVAVIVGLYFTFRRFGRR